MRRLTLDDLYDFQIPSAPAISPDGERIAYVVRTTDRSADEDRHHLRLVPTSGGEPVRLTGGKHDSAPAWSPDGRRVAFLRRGGDGRDQVWVIPVDGGEAEQLTSLALGAGAPQWSHDGAEIAFAAPVASSPLAVSDANTTGSWQDLLTELAAKHQVPGAVLGIAHGDELTEAKHGVLNHNTGVDVTTDSLFQIGSITKAWTATLVMQLVDEGKLALDTPLSHVLPELTLADPEVTQRLTMRHLLSHTSGIDGDVITDTGRGDDCLERYVAELAGVAQNHPLGATMSYCNSGFTLAGRAIERLTGETWDTAIAERIFKPLGLTHTVTLPEDAIRFRTAHGHVGEPGENPSVANTWQLPRSAGPAGLISSTARDVLTFARIHMSSGHAGSGTRLLAQRSVTAMREPHVELPGPFSLADAWGLGWGLMNWDGHRLIGHDGGTIGQYAFLRISPEDDLAVVLLTNGGRASDLYADLFGSMLITVTPRATR
ncbi:MAG: serine hydrolase [Nitriliruptorales bacterium]|nr:serine hydrolase [Nitriliruptorales bacterium]